MRLPNKTKSKRHEERRSFDPSTHGHKAESKMRPGGVGAAVVERPLRFCMRRRVVRARRERGRWSSRVAVSTRSLRRARGRPGRSHRAPVASSSQRPSQIYEMTVLPLLFDTTLGLGATGLGATCLYMFLHLRERFETLAGVVTFSPFRAGKFRRHAKTGCTIAHRSHRVSPATLNKNTKRGGIQQ
jgi:hypothetical protein